MTEEDIRSALGRAMVGDTDGAVDLRGVSQSDLHRATGGRTLELSRSALSAVLHALRAARIEPARAQEWASLMRWGQPFGATPPLTPLDIEYEPEIVEIIGRLDEIGDLIDGEPPTSQELCAMLVTLGES